MVGTNISHYKVIEKIGEGGGETVAPVDLIDPGADTPQETVEAADTVSGHGHDFLRPPSQRHTPGC